MPVESNGARRTRRTVLTLGVGAAAAVTLAPGGAAGAHPAARPAGGPAGRPVVDAVGRLRDLERRHGGRLGVFAVDTGTGRTVRYRDGERFPICSVFKTLAAAAVLRDRGDRLGAVVRYTREDVDRSGYGPITGRPENLANGMTLADLCAATICYSDNAAGNLLLAELGGPTAITWFCRSIGDRVTRLDRWEPELNSAEPGRRTDTTEPGAIARTYGRLALGDALCPADRDRLTGWLRANTTGRNRLRAGLPADWVLGDKTGTGSYGTTNDVGIAWPPGRRPVVVAVLSTRAEPAAPADEPLVAGAAAIVADALRCAWSPTG